VAPTHHAYTIGDTGQDYLITDRVLVSFKEPLPPERVAEFAGKYGLLELEAYSNRDYLFQITDHTGMNPVKLVVKLTEEEPMVAAAENDLNYRAKKQQLTLPTDPAYLRQWHLHGHFNHTEVDSRANSRCEGAWQTLDSFGSPDVVVGVTDDGCKLDHSDFDSPTKFANWGYFEGSSLITRDQLGAQPARMYQAGANHGTSCAGVIAGEADAVLTVGAAPGCRLLPIKWESDGPYLLISDSKLLSALDFVADKVDVLSNSWGNVPMNLTASQVVNRIKALGQTGGRRGRGIVFLWAAGNENCPIQHDAAVLTPYDNGWDFQGAWKWVGVQRTKTFRNNLAGVPGVLHVAALASTARRSHYSNYGTGIGLCAPTSNSHEYWRLDLPGLGITTTTGEAPSITDDFGGTSSATPLVAGIAALVISANPDLTALEIISLLKSTASKDLNTNGYSPTPAATYDPNPTWDVSPIAPFNSAAFQNIGSPDGTWSPWFGHGRVDAAAAVAEALRRRNGSGPNAHVVTRASTPGTAIPDNQSAGIRDSINIPDSGTLASVKVTVDITHTYIGDLRVTLIAPWGEAMVLHDRNGGNGDNIKRTFAMGDTPTLNGAIGRPVTGAWTLHVQDLAAVDTGKLNRWELELGIQTQNVLTLEEAPGVVIPDANAGGLERVLTANQAGQVGSVEVTVDITHTYIGDLNVTLVAPDNTIVFLHQRAGGSSDNLIRAFTPGTTPALSSFQGRPMAGAWRLRVADVEAADVGKLNRWGLKIVKA
jgi:subtilisin-like proprotein convertase family protein/subtilisin family serine protease